MTHALEGEFDQLRERMIGAEMFGRPVGYDTGSDSVVRVKATDVRKKLAQFYAEAKTEPPVRIELPSGSYVPRFHFSDESEANPHPRPDSIAPTLDPQRSHPAVQHPEPEAHAPISENSEATAIRGSRNAPLRTQRRWWRTCWTASVHARPTRWRR